jgi:hypothetical protein
MAERIIPGTYISVRAEGLISAGRIASGIVGIVGTASSGPINELVTLSGYAQAREVFGVPDSYERPEDGANPLTLVRALEHLYNNGASSVIAVRVAGRLAAGATLALKNANDEDVVVLSAKTPGTWGNNISVEVAPAEHDALVEETLTKNFGSLRHSGIVATPQNQFRIVRGATKRSETLTAIYSPGAIDASADEIGIESGQVMIDLESGKLTFASGQEPNANSGDQLMVTYLVGAPNAVQVSIRYGTTIERYTVPDGVSLEKLINRSSALVSADADQDNGGTKPVEFVSNLGTAGNIGGNNGADAAEAEYAAGLELLSTQLVNIVVLAGQDAERMGSVLLGHLKSTAEVDFERIGVIGAAGDTVPDFLGHSMADERIVLVAPGIKYPDGRTLPAAYTAAAVAGLMSSLDVQTSLTNKTLNVPGLAVEPNRGQQEQLIRRNVLTVVRKEGFRVLKGITTSGEGTPFASIPTRRIVDYAKYGVRSASNPYIGRLNNSRVRAALKATLDAFLTRMVDDEALTGYELEVSATRAQEIAGEVNVVMTLQPTFSIDYIRVTMNLK